MRKAIIVTTVLMIVFLTVSIVEANPVDLPPNDIESPRNYKIKVYQNTTIPIEARFWSVYTKIIDMYYVLDNGNRIELSISNSQNKDCYIGRGILENLTDGYHTLKVYAKDSDEKRLVAETTFLVDTNLRYTTLFLSPLNLTYYNEEIPLTYTIDETKYQVFYSLDNSSFKRIYGNTTLTGLSEGQHVIFASAWSASDGIYTEQTVNFTIDTTTPSSTAEPPLHILNQTTLTAIIFVVLVLSVSLCSYYYLKKR